MNRLKELRKATGKSQKDFYNEIVVTELNLGVTLRTYQNWEKPENEIKSKPANSLAEYFNVPVSYLLGYDDKDFEKQIRIDTLNNLLYKMHTAYVSLLEKTDKEAFWAGFETAELIVQTQKMILEFEESANGK